MENVGNSYSRLSPALEASRFLQRELSAKPWLGPLLENTLDTPLTPEAMQAFLAREAPDESCLKRGLRHLRAWVNCHTAARDLLGLAPLAEVMEAMTVLAEVAISHAHRLLFASLAARHGAPQDAQGAETPLIVVGMGKLGGRELNVSSDIDLIFVYPEEGDTHGPRPLSHYDFFTRLGRLIIAALGEATEDGFVFRVDMRLRPNGDSGPLASSFDALENYFITQGREWERFAWIKARALTGNRHEELTRIVRPFVYRKYLDFGAINALRALHAQIRAQVVRREMADNIKLGPGGIREIEFTAQIFQIVRGGRDPLLQIRPTVPVLHALVKRGLLDSNAADGLEAAYTYLRRLEHRLQYLDDAQTHDLPAQADDRARIARAMSHASESALRAELELHREVVSAHFQAACADPNESRHALDEVWSAAGEPDQAEARFAALGYADPAAAAGRLAQLRSSGRYRQLPEPIRERLDALVPRVIEGCGALPNPDDTLARTLTLLDTIMRRGAYLALLQQYPQALRRLQELASASSWGTAYLTTHPLLLDDLLDARQLNEAPDWPAFAAQLREQLDQCEPDTERQMDLLREQHHTQVFRILHQDLAGRWEVEAIGDHLTALADVILAETVRLCWRKLRKVHRDEPRFAVIAYGKYGGKELGYASDLDLVFIYDDDAPEAAETYARLAQRVSTWLSSRTVAGILFETDLRLRPNGDAGLLACSVEAFRQYQENSAWVWEHQALTRARFAAGDAAVGAAFDTVRETLLRRPRELDTLRDEVLAMRRKMLDSLGSRDGRFSVKQDPGGLIDFEFIIQYLVLGFAHTHPHLVANLGNIALARIAGELGLVDADTAHTAANAYRELRRMQHRLRLNEEQTNLPGDAAKAERTAISALWMAVFGRTA